MSLMIDFCGLQFEGPLMNAAGTCKTVEEVRLFARTPVCAIVVGSYTYDSRLGNDGITYYADNLRSINSKGIPNGGRAYLQKFLPEMVRIAHDAGKFLIVSVAGFTPEEFAELANIAYLGEADAIEVNLACPNLWTQSTGKQKPIFGFYREMVAQVVDAVEKRTALSARVGYKLPPYSNPVQLIDMARVLYRSQKPPFLSLINTFPNAFGVYPNGELWIGPQYGGMAGPALKPIGLGHVRQVHAEFPDVPIIGMGGIRTGQDVKDYRDAGASATAIATGQFEEGFNIYSRVLHEYTDLV